MAFAAAAPRAAAAAAAPRAGARPAGRPRRAAARAGARRDGAEVEGATEADALSERGAALAALGSAPLATLLAMPPAATAAVSPVASAGAAYGHFLCLTLMIASLTVERLTVSAKPTKDDLTTLLVADSVYGIAGIGMLYTGYLRVTQYGKGWDFYQHEPLFWTKMFLFGVVGSASLFCTANIIRCQIAMTEADGVPPVVGEKLANRMKKIINAELTGFFSIPFVATLMARGVSYDDGFDWHIGAGLVALGSVGAGVKYVKEALTFEVPGEDVEVSA